jgi:hypothetical protein
MNNTIALQKTYILYATVSGHIAQFPKLERYTLGIKIDNTILELLTHIITAEQTVPVLKDRALTDASVSATLATMLLRLSMEKKLIKETNYFTWTGQLQEIGKMIGGWKKSLAK